MLEIAACPLCHHAGFTEHLTCRDYTATGESFTIRKCAQCGFLLTNPRPPDTGLPRYYDAPAYLSHAKQSRGLLSHAYTAARSLTVRWKLSLVRQYTSPAAARLLDYGCGTGSFLSHASTQGFTVAGVEPAPQAREEARRLLSNRVSSSLADVTDDYDAITLWHVLEHVGTLHETFAALTERMTSNGTIFIAVPNHQSHDARHYGAEWAAYDVPRHLWHFSPDTMRHLLSAHGLTLARTVPMRLDAYYVCLLSEKYRRGSLGPAGLASALRQAWISNQKARTTRDYSSLIYIARK